MKTGFFKETEKMKLLRVVFLGALIALSSSASSGPISLFEECQEYTGSLFWTSVDRYPEWRLASLFPPNDRVRTIKKKLDGDGKIEKICEETKVEWSKLFWFGLISLFISLGFIMTLLKEKSLIVGRKSNDKEKHQSYVSRRRAMLSISLLAALFALVIIFIKIPW